MKVIYKKILPAYDIVFIREYSPKDDDDYRRVMSIIENSDTLELIEVVGRR